jgi:Spermine/spermidine synthase domain
MKTGLRPSGGEGATAREVLRHRSVEELVMVDIDQVVCDFCEQHLEANKAAFADPRMKLIYDDARAQLERAEGEFDVIIGDLADPLDGGPCYQVCVGCAAIHRILVVVSRPDGVAPGCCRRLWAAAPRTQKG